MTEFAVDDESFVCAVPEELRDVAVLVEPLSIAEKALSRIQKVEDHFPWVRSTHDPQSLGRHRVAVVAGAGPVGLLGAVLLSLRGFQVWVYSRSTAPNPRAEIVDLIGVTYVSSEESSVDDLAEQLGRIDLIYEAAAVPQLTLNILGVLGPNGIMILTGVSAPRLTEFDAGSMMRTLVLRNQILTGTVNADRNAFEAAVRHLATFDKRWPAAVSSLITNRFALEATPEVLMGSSGGIKNVISLDEALGGGPEQSPLHNSSRQS